MSAAELLKYDSPERAQAMADLRALAYPTLEPVQPQPQPSSSLTIPTTVASKATKSPNPAALLTVKLILMMKLK